MAITDYYHKGEKILIRVTVTKSDASALNYSDMTAVTATVYDRKGTELSYTKAGGTVVQGTAANEIEFEITNVESATLFPGVIRLKLDITYANASFSSSTAISISRDYDLFTIRT